MITRENKGLRATGPGNRARIKCVVGAFPDCGYYYYCQVGEPTVVSEHFSLLEKASDAIFKRGFESYIFGSNSLVYHRFDYRDGWGGYTARDKNDRQFIILHKNEGKGRQVVYMVEGKLRSIYGVAFPIEITGRAGEPKYITILKPPKR